MSEGIDPEIGRAISIRVASAKGVADRWREQYYNRNGNTWPNTVSGSSEVVYNKLVELGPDPDPDQAAIAIGNESWTHVRCEGCNGEFLTGVAIGDYEVKTFCLSCVEMAAKRLRAWLKVRGAK